MNTVYLNTFLKAAELKSFRKAAAALQYSQPTVTSQIRTLEAELGVPLFHRTAKGTMLSEQGEQLVPYAKKILRDWEEAAGVVSNTERFAGHINIGCPDSIALFLLQDLMRKYCQAYDGVTVKVRTAEFPTLIQEMEQNTLDFIYILNQRFERSQWRRIFERKERIVFVCHPEHTLTTRADLTLADLAQEKLVLADTGNTTSYIYELMKLMEEKKLTPRCALEVSNPAIIKEMVLNRVGITFLPYFAVREDVEADRLAVLPVKDAQVNMWLQVFCMNGKWLSPAMVRFLELIHT